MRNNDNSAIGRFLADLKRERLARIILVLLLITATLLTIVLSSRPTFAATGDGWDLSNFVNGVVITDSQGDPVADGSFVYGSTYTFSITFAEDGGANQFVYDNGVLTYTLPPQLQITMPVTDVVITASNGVPIGQYTLDAGGNVEVWFDNVDNQGNPTTNGSNFIDRYQNATFTLDIHAKFNPDAEPGQIDFGADTTITVTQISEPEAGVTVDKGASADCQVKCNS